MRDFFNKLGHRLSSDPNKIGAHGLTKLQDAITDNNMGRVLSLIKAGCDINYRGMDYLPPLHMAIADGKHHIAIALIQAGADINLPDARGQTPLHLAALLGHEGFALSLIKLGADPNIRDDNGHTPLHIVATDRPGIVQHLVKNKADLNAPDDFGNTALHIFLTNPLFAGLLLEAGANVNAKNAKGFSPYALSLNDDMVARFPLLPEQMKRHGADLSATTPQGETILHVMARLRRPEAFLRLLPFADNILTARDSRGNTAVHTLMDSFDPALVAAAIAKAPALVHISNAEGLSPLEYLLTRAPVPPQALPERYVQAVRMMIDAGADANATDMNGTTFLHIAALHRHEDFAEFMASRMDNINAADKSGRAALQIAVEQNSVAVLDRLLDCGADPDLTDKNGWTVLDRLAEKKDRDSPLVQRLIVGGGIYKKQLPLHGAAPVQNGAPAKPIFSKDGFNKPAFNKPAPPVADEQDSAADNAPVPMIRKTPPNRKAS